MFPTIRRLIGAVGAAVLTLIVLVPAPAHAAPSFHSVFSYPPLDGTRDLTIENKFIELTDAAVPGSSIHVVFFSLTRTTVSDALLAADTRGVDVNVVAEQDENESTAKRELREELPADNFTYCDDGCLGTTGTPINHNKIWIFSELSDGRTDVVLQTSQNPTNTQTWNHNNAVIVSDAPGLTDAYLSYFDQLKAQQITTFSGSVSAVGGKVELFFSPRNRSSDEARYGNSDIVAAMFEQVSCPAGSIRIAMAIWTSTRPAIASVLEDKKRAGCHVEVIVEARAEGVPGLQDAEISVLGLREGGCRYPARDLCNVGRVHSKYALVDTGSEQLVYTGSHNYSYSAMAINDETLMRIDDASTYAAFEADYERLRRETIAIQPERYPSASYTTVNTTAAGDQDSPAVDANGAGDRVIVWEDAPGTSNTNAQVLLRRYRDGDPQPVQTLSLGGSGDWSHLDPDVAVDDAGNAIVVWAEDSGGNGYREIQIVRVSRSGDITDRAVANGSSAGDQVVPAVDATGSGDFTVTWETTPSPGASTGTVSAAGFTADFTKVYESRVSAAGGHDNQRPDVGVDDSGTAVFVWDEDSDDNGVYNVGLKALDANGDVVLSERNVNVETGGQQTHGSVAVTPSGQFTVAWRDDRTGGRRIWVRGFQADGSERFGERILTPPPPSGCSDCPPDGSQTTPSVAIADDGTAIVAWNETAPLGTDIWARGVASDGSFSAFPAYRMNPGTPGDQDYAATASTPGGEFVISFADDGDGNGYDQLRLRAGFHHD